MDLKKEAKKVVFQCRESKTGQSFDSALFSAMHVIQSHLTTYWQQFFERELGITYQDNDCYQFHAYVLKKNRYTVMQRRFIVLSTKWMYNSDAQFEKSGQRQLKFKKTKWKSALEALSRITLSTKNNRVIITLDFNLEV